MIELLTNRQMARTDRLTIAAGTPGIMLMENAGRAVADVAAAPLPPRSRIAVVCGPGNNGGDGFVAARLLAARGHRVELHLAGDADALRGDAAEVARRWPGATLAADPERLAHADTIVDALFGAGLVRPVAGVPAALIAAMNASGSRIVAVDLPSGVNGDSGQVMGAAVRAQETVTFFRRKPGHLLLPGRLHCGCVTVADIGIPESVLAQIESRAFANEPPLWATQFPVLGVDSHKYIRGHALVVSGGLASTGAARLAARGALRAGAGLVTIATPADALAVHAAENLAVMVRLVDGPTAFSRLLEDARINAVVQGPGGGVGEDMRRTVSITLSGERAVVLDADALTSFADRLRELRASLREHSGPAVLTPHDGEFARLFSNIPEVADRSSKIDKVLAAAAYLDAIVLLKGPDTVVATPEGRAAVAANAPPWLATAGAGDVLAGMIAGLLAQKMPTFEAACAAVWLHGEAANRFGPSLISEDLPDALPPVIATLLQDRARRRLS